jgi:beta-glucosidase/6-phospho-beta-glucosidase/beta-galactosidase
VLAGYLLPSSTRTNPPGVSFRWTEAKRATAAMIEAHSRMVDAVKANDLIAADGSSVPARVGLVYNLQAVTPKDPLKPRDVQAAKDISYLMNQMFLDGAIKGDLDLGFDGKTVHRADLGRADFLGVNYYVRVVVEGLGSSLFPEQSPFMTFNPFTLDSRWNDPTGLGEVLDFAKQRYGIPVVITETGYQDGDDNGAAAGWIKATVGEVRAAVSRGVDVQGYFYWTLMDNYEWNHGMTVKMGLYEVDPNDPQKKRRPRANAIAAFARAAVAHVALQPH